MSQHPAVTGSCLCGAVKFEIAPPALMFKYCHCTRCRKPTGAAHAANLFIPAGQFKWLAGESLLRHFDLPGAYVGSHFGERMIARVQPDDIIDVEVVDSDVTHHGTPMEAGEGYASKQYLPSRLIDWGELSVEFLWNPNNPPPKGKAKQTIRYTYPLEDGEATPAKEEFSGFITSGPSKSIPVDGVMTAKMTIKVCSKPVETEAT